MESQATLRMFLAILLAHLLADFPLQSDAMAAGKKHRKLPLLQYGLVHYVVLLMMMALFTHLASWSVRVQLWLVGYVGLHIALDLMKVRLARRTSTGDPAYLFVLDQTLHLATVCALTWVFTRYRWIDLQVALSWSDTRQLHVLLTAVVYVAVIFGGGYLIRYFTRSLTQQLSSSNEETTEDLRNAGLYIGWLERFLVLTAVLVQSPAMIGLILTGKSIARFPELKGAKFAEYFLIGTFLSIGMALLGGIVLAQGLFGSASFK